MRSGLVLFVAGAALLGLALGAGCDSSSTGGDGSPGSGKAERSVFTVRGMTCQGCVDTVTRAVEAVPGVEKVEVSLEKEQAVVMADPERATPEKIVAAIEQAGSGSEFEAEPVVEAGSGG